MPSPYAQNVSQFHAVFFGNFHKNSTQNPDSNPDVVHFILKSVQKPECIPLGCVPSAAVVVCWQGGVYQEVSAQGVSAQGVHPSIH